MCRGQARTGDSLMRGWAQSHTLPHERSINPFVSYLLVTDGESLTIKMGLSFLFIFYLYDPQHIHKSRQKIDILFSTRKKKQKNVFLLLSSGKYHHRQYHTKVYWLVIKFSDIEIWKKCINWCLKCNCATKRISFAQCLLHHLSFSVLLCNFLVVLVVNQ